MDVKKLQVLHSELRLRVSDALRKHFNISYNFSYNSPGAMLTEVVYEDILCSSREDSAMSALSSTTGRSDWTTSLWAESDNEWAGTGRMASWEFTGVVTMETSEIKGCSR